jgi:hypothetical protein
MPFLNSLRWLTAAIPYPVLAPQRVPATTVAGAAEDGQTGEYPVCKHPSCGRPLPEREMRQWRRLEGQILCSGGCWSAMLRERIERETFGWKQSERARHAHRVPLGLLLLSMGWITKQELDTALQAQRKAKKGRIGEWLRRQTALTEKELTRALAMQWNCPVFDLADYRPQPVEIPREILESYRILPLPARGRNALFLAFESAVDTVSSYAIQHITGMRTEAGVTGEEEFGRTWARSLELQNRASATVAVTGSEEICNAAASVLRGPEIADARLIRLHQHLWLRAILHEAEDRPGPAQHRDYLYLLPPRPSLSLAERDK